MPDTFTPNYNFTKPEVNASRDTWGGKHNTNWGLVDTALKALTDAVNARFVNVKSLSFVGNNKAAPAFIHTDNTSVEVATATELAAAVAPLATTAAMNTADNARVLTTTYNAGVANLQSQIDAEESARAAADTALVPRGIIAMWYGSVASIPAGWALCNGANGTPDMRNRFVVGAGDDYSPLATGGANTHNHNAATTGSTALSVAQMPSHSHGVTDPTHRHTGVTSSDSHTHALKQAGGGTVGDRMYYSVTDGTAINVPSDSHSHSFTSNYSATGISIQSTGSGSGHTHSIPTSSTEANVPVYRALCFIMKL